MFGAVSHSFGGVSRRGTTKFNCNFCSIIVLPVSVVFSGVFIEHVHKQMSLASWLSSCVMSVSSNPRMISTTYHKNYFPPPRALGLRTIFLCCALYATVISCLCDWHWLFHVHSRVSASRNREKSYLHRPHCYNGTVMRTHKVALQIKPAPTLPSNGHIAPHIFVFRS